MKMTIIGKMTNKKSTTLSRWWKWRNPIRNDRIM